VSVVGIAPSGGEAVAKSMPQLRVLCPRPLCLSGLEAADEVVLLVSSIAFSAGRDGKRLL
jgi:hypothetical protein